MRALVLGAGGFIGHNLVKRLKKEGWEVDGIDLHYPYFEDSPADKFLKADLSRCWIPRDHDRIYALAADMGGAGFVFTGDNDADILTNSLSINLNILNQLKDFKGTIFYSSSVCVYPAGSDGAEGSAYPANPPSNYGWEKLTSERLYESYAKNHNLDIRIARFHNTYGPYGTFEGGREKAPAAICRKVLDSTNRHIEIWGTGRQQRPFIYIDDLLDGIEALMQSDIRTPVNLGPKESVTIDNLVDAVCRLADKALVKVLQAGPTGELVRNTNCQLAYKKLNWEPRINLEGGLAVTYAWIRSQRGQV